MSRPPFASDISSCADHLYCTCVTHIHAHTHTHIHTNTHTRRHAQAYICSLLCTTKYERVSVFHQHTCTCLCMGDSVVHKTFSPQCDDKLSTLSRWWPNLNGLSGFMPASCPGCIMCPSKKTSGQPMGMCVLVTFGILWFSSNRF